MPSTSRLGILPTAQAQSGALSAPLMAKAVHPGGRRQSRPQPSPSHEALLPGHRQGLWTLISSPRLNWSLLF